MTTLKDLLDGKNPESVWVSRKGLSEKGVYFVPKSKIGTESVFKGQWYGEYFVNGFRISTSFESEEEDGWFPYDNKYLDS